LTGHPKRPARRRLSYANITSTIALVIAVGGGSALAASRLITGSQIAPGTITAKNIKDHSLLGTDFKKGQLPRGARGAQGPSGAAGAGGAAGPAGTAVAYGQVSLNGVGNPAFISNVGFPGVVTEPQANVFCIVPPSGFASTPIVITPFGATNSLFQSVSPQQCPGDYEISASGTFTSGQGFTVVVP
jgi:hypothetical protein